MVFLITGALSTDDLLQGVFTYLLENLGVKNVQFEELLDLEPHSLAQLSPLGVIFLFKYIGSSSADTRDGNLDFDAAESNKVWFAAQTIQNACGTQALLSVLMNKDEKDGVKLGGTLGEFKEFTAQFPPEFRGEALSNSDLIRDVHNSFARSSPFQSGETKVANEDDDVYHFIAFTSVDDKLYELDGLQQAPISHGECKADEFSEKVIPVLQRRISKYPANEIRFNLLAMCQDLRTKAQEFGDDEMLMREEEKRRQWQWENALRRHNFVGFVGELLKAVVKKKIDEGTYESWVNEAKDRTKKKLEDGRKKGVASDEMEM